MKEEFDKYVSNYPIDNSKIKRKIEHSYRVMELSKKYATILGFNDYDIKLATLIGLIHDIGRFEQVRVYNTFNDRTSIDHASYGVKILFEDGLIKNFWDNTLDYEVIKFAIENHNKLEIEPTTNERALMHAKLIRDIDKLDIIYILSYLDEINLTPTDDDITKEIIERVEKHQSVLNKDKKNDNDRIVYYLSYIFDVNYNECLNEFKKYINDYYKKIKNNDKLKKIYKEVIEYIDERMKLC